MKKLFTTLSLFLVMTFTLFGQADTVFIPGSTALGILEEAILGDTTATGERVNPERCYKLERGKIYRLTGWFPAYFDLCIIADEPDADNRPPIIVPSASSIPHLFSTHGNVYFKNIYISNIAPDGSRDYGAFIDYKRVVGTDTLSTVEFDGCYFEGNRFLAAGTWDQAKKLIVRNCVVRNAQNIGVINNGRGFDTRDYETDTVIIENSTFYNLNSYAFRGEWNKINYFRFSHNTVVNTMEQPIHWAYPTNADVSDNLFYNAHAWGQAESEYSSQLGEVFGVYNIYPLDSAIFINNGFAEADRRINLHRNNWFFSQPIQDYWTSIDSVNAIPWMNTATQGAFDDDTAYPMLSEVGTTNMDPGFINEGNDGTVSTIDSFIHFLRATRDTNLVANYWGYEPDPSAPAFQIQWPLPENLAYTNATLKTAAPGGCPIGDLNWWPDLKEGCMAVGTDEPFSSKGLTVEQNMPNPFKGQTTIAYTLADAANVSVTIIDINGKVITSLINEKQPQGRHTVEWNAGSQATGVYFYQIKTDNALITRKLELVK